MRSRKARQQPLKLKIEPMPQILWRQNLRTELGQHRWNKLRRSVRQNNCAICSSTDGLEAHEVWEYCERPRVSVAKLARIETTCKKCHLIIHWFNTRRLVATGKISRADDLALRRHFCVVNKCLRQVFNRHVLESALILNARSLMRWRVDWGTHKCIIAKASAERAAFAIANPKHESQADYAIIDPGHHISGKCPRCGSFARRVIEQDRSNMSEGEEADYDAGMWGTAKCGHCGLISDFGF